MGIEVDIKHKLQGFELAVDWESEEKRIGILGASGSGKSMMLKSIAGIIATDIGRISVQDKIFYDSKHKINVPAQKRRVGYLFQNYALFPTMTTEKNIEMGIVNKKGSTKQENKIKIQELICRFSLEGLEKRYPYELSGGQQQRVALARIMAYEPELILLDEPFSALDSFLKDHLKKQMQDMLETYKGIMIMVSHSRDELYEFSNHLLIMSNGKLMESGNTQRLFARPDCMESARLTGCKNISEVRKIDDYTVESLTWGIRLTTANLVKDNLKYIGIRAHDLQEGKEGEINCFQYSIVSESRTPFEKIYLLQPIVYGQAAGKESIWWKSPYHRERLENSKSGYVYIPPEDILLFSM